MLSLRKSVTSNPFVLGTTTTLTLCMLYMIAAKARGFASAGSSQAASKKLAHRGGGVNKINPESIPLPSLLHRVVPKSELQDQVLVVGDVHGCYDELQLLLKRVGYNDDPSKWTLIFVGDLVNKGPKSAECVKFARESGALCVRGNHDDACLATYMRVGRYKDLPPDEYPKGREYVKDLTSADAAWLRELPLSLALPSLGALVVHAGLVPGPPLEEQLWGDLTRMRNVVEAEDGKGLEGNEKGDAGEPWVQRWVGPAHVFFGHDAKRGLQLAAHATGLDTGACYGKYLTAVVLPEHTLVQVKSFETYEAPGGPKVHF